MFSHLNLPRPASHTTSNPLVGPNPARLDALLLIARHMRRHPDLPEPDKIRVDHTRQHVSLILVGPPPHELRGLLAWADSLTEPGFALWRSASSGSLLVVVYGTLSTTSTGTWSAVVPYTTTTRSA